MGTEEGSCEGTRTTLALGSSNVNDGQFVEMCVLV